MLRLTRNSIFISYSRADASAYADSLADVLTPSGYSVFHHRLGTQAREFGPLSEVDIDALRDSLLSLDAGDERPRYSEGCCEG